MRGSDPHFLRNAVAGRWLANAAILAGIFVFGSLDVRADAPHEDSQTSFEAMLRATCLDCHSGDTPEGDLSLAELKGTLSSDEQAELMLKVADQLNQKTMPPREAAPLEDAVRQQCVTFAVERATEWYSQHAEHRPQTILRRMNSREYTHTIRDLFQINVSMFHPAQKFPRDQVVESLDNVGQSLVTSGYLLERYLDAAELVVEKAMGPLKQPAIRTWEFHDGFRQQPEIDQVHKDTSRFAYLILYDVPGADKPEGAYAPIHAFAEGVPHDGYYEITFRANALNRDHPYDDDYLRRDRKEPLRLGIVAGNRDAGPLYKSQPIEPVLAELELQDGDHEYTVRVWLDAGFTPRFTFPNGLMDVRNIWGTIHRRHGDLLPKPPSRGIVDTRRNAIANGKLPQIHVDDIRIHGPLYDQWPTASQRMLLADDWEDVAESGQMTEQQIRNHLQRLASQAYRRPVHASEIDRLMMIVTARMQSGQTSLHAYADAIKAMLCSPGFLYLDESSRAEGGQLSSWAMASRLSYFLWASMPDEELRRLAEQDQLQDPTMIVQQVDRLLSDARSDAFVDGFLDSWLTLRDLGSMPPDRQTFSDFYQFNLGAAMRQETRLFTRHLLDENLSVSNYLDSNFTFVNRPLARLYGIQPPDGPAFYQVSLTDSRRGGLLGQASVLTVTANGIDTSPVVRGIWILENLLGTPPPPPPSNVEPLDPDIRGATTIRDQLQKHRHVPACNRCHRKIDPLGFACENFDAIGRWRDEYKRGLPIDSSGELPDGQQFEQIGQLKRILQGRLEQFETALAGRLLAYATGRQLQPADRPELFQICRQLHGQGDGFRDLVKLVATSRTFRSP
ncbi:MAG: DUF1592 domain-containing protein [Planctomycetaceae bacterium]|nr:DUF1592 domain-containing protein [Planctomycetaceae bacterium]